MIPVRVKICGITSLDDLALVIAAGADAVGFIVDVPTSSRNLTREQAKILIDATPPFTTSVVVTVAHEPNLPCEIYRQLKPNAVQIHGLNNRLDKLRTLLPTAQIIGAINTDPKNLEQALQITPFCDALLVDSFVSGKHGGTGQTHDWTNSNQLRNTITPTPLILAGGLTSQNVQKAIQTVKPYAVDVASGVEQSPGKKDPKKVLEFIKNAKEMS